MVATHYRKFLHGLRRIIATFRLVCLLIRLGNTHFDLFVYFVKNGLHDLCKQNFKTEMSYAYQSDSAKATFLHQVSWNHDPFVLRSRSQPVRRLPCDTLSCTNTMTIGQLETLQECTSRTLPMSFVRVRGSSWCKLARINNEGCWWTSSCLYGFTPFLFSFSNSCLPAQILPSFSSNIYRSLCIKLAHSS